MASQKTTGFALSDLGAIQGPPGKAVESRKAEKNWLSYSKLPTSDLPGADQKDQVLKTPGSRTLRTFFFESGLAWDSQGGKQKGPQRDRERPKDLRAEEMGQSSVTIRLKAESGTR